MAAKIVMLIAQGEEKDDLHLLATARRPDLVMLLGAISSEPQLMLITGFMDGGCLELHYTAMRKDYQRPNWHAAFGQQVDWCSAVARGLCLLHSCWTPVIHRDLKPPNLLRTKRLDVRITDVGISKMMAPMGCKLQKIHMMGVVSLQRMAPDVVRNGRYDTKADMWLFAFTPCSSSSRRGHFWERTSRPTSIPEEQGKQQAAETTAGRHARISPRHHEGCPGRGAQRSPRRWGAQ
ncbi:unnamed protein product [Prorocentrum cordatum]|uniref:Protein kinase domain-containing protein n=1 Tax=Prorocentrum cordatum TaxID=2364126 RepID=A0ABN9UDS6_9DINO|nr:unnamed protein product [Polarella glacialis]